MGTLYDIERVVPHRGTMRLVDRLVDWDEDTVAVELRVPDEGPFSHDDGVPACAMYSTPYFRAGSLLRVEATRELLGENGLGMFSCRILGDGKELATANVSVFEPPDAMAYLESVQA